MVTLLKPIVPLCPVKVKEKIVVVVEVFTEIMAFNIWEPVMLPFSERVTIAPLSVDTCNVDFGLGVWAGEGVGVGIRIGVGAGVTVAFGAGVV